MKSASAGAHSDVSDPKGLFVVGVDLASRSIRLCSEDPGTGEILNREVSREEFEGLIRKRGGPSMRLVMEACGSSNYWGSIAEMNGHAPVIVPARFVHGCSSGSKDDARDAECIWQMGYVPKIKSVRLRGAESRMALALLRFRESVLKGMGGLANRIRALSYELGSVSGKGAPAAVGALDKLCEETEREAPGSVMSENLAAVSSAACGLMKAITKAEQAIDERVMSLAESDGRCRLLMTIPCVGPVAAVAISAFMEDPASYRNGRQFAARCCAVPLHTGSGGKITILGIPPRGGMFIRRILFEAAMGMYNRVMRQQKDGREGKGEVPKALSEWIVSLAGRMPVKKAVSAIVNKLCRISWAVLRSGRPYDQEKSSLVPPSAMGPDGKVRNARAMRKSAARKLLQAVGKLESFLERRKGQIPAGDDTARGRGSEADDKGSEGRHGNAGKDGLK
ncbi:MAG: IS110 family transposase [Proteobacteria bacterium]|nr:IS110 family transposase [Pseudomonadota bacterium]MDY6375969.1 IS110 family transposase [Succinivibrionaceae bacterium]